MVFVVNTEMTLFAYVNLKGGPKTSDIWFLKVKSVPSAWSFSSNWDILTNINRRNERSQLDSFHLWDFHPSEGQTGHGLRLKCPASVWQMVQLTRAAIPWPDKERSVSGAWDSFFLTV